MYWKFLIVCFLGSTPLLAQEEKSYDLEVMEVMLDAEVSGYRSFKYAIKNNGPEAAPAGSYQVFFKVNGKMISFDTKTTTMKAGQSLIYTAGEKYRANQPGKKLKYRLIIKAKDSNKSNNKLKGEIVL
ncbi:hypothetical protein [Cyclobacterium qasimii]|uniref:CARDB domain-containing protein n=2 Tax=Cyclobacterium qasimii TaxID=1350429 RepID=S7V9R1_9BACT|nr:hypothetical protein [Cyclobacterium qasimii]EPR66302.1 hypothetical protein ADICYQ_4705 [Cyclobacterium qasimii M12-11B]GEO21038.1 hypothetical protein CQA01_15720 [Cyclobacterium qasimii]